jgi:hypothetical protein
MRVIELKPEQLPLVIRLKADGQCRDYVLIRTKQDKLLLNRPNDVSPTRAK